jgi:hypothetical protein
MKNEPMEIVLTSEIRTGLVQRQNEMKAVF